MQIRFWFGGELPHCRSVLFDLCPSIGISAGDGAKPKEICVRLATDVLVFVLKRARHIDNYHIIRWVEKVGSCTAQKYRSFATRTRSRFPQNLPLIKAERDRQIVIRDPNRNRNWHWDWNWN